VCAATGRCRLRRSSSPLCRRYPLHWTDSTSSCRRTFKLGLIFELELRWAQISPPRSRQNNLTAPAKNLKISRNPQNGTYPPYLVAICQIYAAFKNKLSAPC
jgi:hypothetical protein